MSRSGDPASALRVLISVSSFGLADAAPLARLESIGCQIIPNPYGRRLSEDEIADLIGDVHVVIAGTEPLNARVLRAAKELKVISRVGVGLENVDLNVALQLGIAVRNTPDALTDAVAELTLCGILSMARQVARMDRELRAGEWNRHMGVLLRGKTVGIVGLGRIGRRLAELLAPFRVELLASDRAPDAEAAARLGVSIVEVNELFERSDIISLHLPGLGHPIIGAAGIDQMKPGVMLVNASRGGLIDELALAEALRDGQVGGAYIDTFVNEPYTGVLTDMPTAVLTPHAGSYAAETRAVMEFEAVDNMITALREFWPDDAP